MSNFNMPEEKLTWNGKILSVQPRIRLWRSFDQRSHTYLGYVLQIEDSGTVISVAIGKAAQAKHQFKVGDIVSGESLPVADPRRETADYYKTSKLKLFENSEPDKPSGPPWIGVPPDLPTYRERGHRRLSVRTYETSCTSCIWGCRMPVEMIIDHWNPSNVRYRFETFCYGPKSCKLYKAGSIRKVPGRRGMTWEEEDWVDEDATAHRGEDD